MKLFTPVIIALLFTVFVGSNSSAQELYDVADFLKITGNSAVKYQFEALKSPVKSDHDASNINYSMSRLRDSLGKREVVPFNVSHDVNELYELGWEAIELDEIDTALAIFDAAIELDPKFSPAYTGKGYTLNFAGLPFEAIDVCKMAVALNPIDYIAYWTIATAWDKLNSPDSALNAILHAWILNRNHPEIIKDVKRFAEKGGLVLDNWVFNPQYETIFEDGVVHISYWRPWMGYAICMSVWDYEPGFLLNREIRGDEESFRERECLSCLLTSINTYSVEALADPGLKGFRKAMERKLASEFILFDIFLPYKPDLSYMFNDYRIERLKQYIYEMKLR